MFKEHITDNIDVEEVTKEISKYLFNNKKLACAYIFGSFGTNEFSSKSDIDIAILPYSEFDYQECLNLSSELEELVGIRIDLNNINLLPEHIQVQIIIRNNQLFSKSDEVEQGYLDRLNHWIKTEYPFWRKLITNK